MALLSSDVEHVLVNVVNALRVLSEDSPDNQKTVGESNAIPTLIELVGMISFFYLFVCFFINLAIHLFYHLFGHSFIHLFMH